MNVNTFYGLTICFKLLLPSAWLPAAWLTNKLLCQAETRRKKQHREQRENRQQLRTVTASQTRDQESLRMEPSMKFRLINTRSINLPPSLGAGGGVGGPLLLAGVCILCTLGGNYHNADCIIQWYITMHYNNTMPTTLTVILTFPNTTKFKSICNVSCNALLDTGGGGFQNLQKY